MVTQFGIRAFCTNPNCGQGFFVSETPTAKEPVLFKGIDAAFSYQERLATESSIIGSGHFASLPPFDAPPGKDSLPEYYRCPACLTIVPRHEAFHQVAEYRSPEAGAVDL